VRVTAVLVGKPKITGTPDSDNPMERVFRSAIWKEPVAGPVWLGTEGLAGDDCASRDHHGGAQQAVCVYPVLHWDRWRAIFPERDSREGWFGENFAVEGIDEHQAAIGDVFELGEARVEISCPRMPCGTLARRWQLRDFAKRVLEEGRMGWYFRVLREGHVEAGQPLRLEARPNPDWNIARAANIFSNRARDREGAEALAAVPALSPEWKRHLAPRN